MGFGSMWPDGVRGMELPSSGHGGGAGGVTEGVLCLLFPRPMGTNG